MKRLKILAILGTAVATFACAGSQSFREAREEETLGHWDIAVLKYSRASDLDPTNLVVQAGAHPGQVPGLAGALREGQDLSRLGRAGSRGRGARAGGRPGCDQQVCGIGAPQGPRGGGQARCRPRRRDEARGDQAPGKGPEGQGADARAGERQADQPELSAGQAHQADLPRPGGRRRDQHHLRSAVEGRQRLDRADQHRVPEGARDPHAPGEPLLQGHRRQDDHDRRRQPAEPEDLRGPGPAHVLSQQRRPDGRLQCDPPASADDAHLRQQGRELDYAARHRGQSRDRRTDRRAERQAAGRGHRGRRADAGQLRQDAGSRADPLQLLDGRLPAVTGREDRQWLRDRGGGRRPEHVSLEPAAEPDRQLSGIHDSLGRYGQLHQEQHGRGAARQARSSGSRKGRRRSSSSATSSRSRRRSSTRRPFRARTSCRSRRSSTRTWASRSTSSPACTTTRRSRSS